MVNQSFGGPEVHGLDDDFPLRVQVNLEKDGLQDLIDHFPFRSRDPHVSEKASSFISRRIPDLWRLACSVRSLLQRGVRTLVIEDLPFAQFDLRTSKYALLAFASCIGKPIGADHYRRDLVWPVSPKLEFPPAYTPTITEHAASAELHTDSAFKSMPEGYVLLFAYQPASDGGGKSLLLSASKVLKKLSGTESGRECIRILRSTHFPFRVPTAFTRNRRDVDLELIGAPILSHHPQIRYRDDLIMSALERLRTPLSSEAEGALTYFKETLHQQSRAGFTLNRGELLVLNNHCVLHGRTAFTDQDRMLLRVRLANTHSVCFPEGLT